MLIETAPVSVIPKGKQVRGVNVIGREVFVSRKQLPEVEVYDALTLTLQRRVGVPELTSPCSTAFDAVQSCLYVTDCEGRAVHRVPTSGRHVTKWPTVDRPDGVSVSAIDAGVVVAFGEARKLKTYKSDGTALNEFSLQNDVVGPRHAIQLTKDEYLVCHSHGDPVEHRVGRFGSDGRLIQVAVVPPPSHTKYSPTFLAVDGTRGVVFVVDFFNDRILTLNATLNDVCVLISASSGIRRPFRLFFDETRRQLYVGEFSDAARVFVIPL